MLIIGLKCPLNLPYSAMVSEYYPFPDRGRISAISIDRGYDSMNGVAHQRRWRSETLPRPDLLTSMERARSGAADVAEILGTMCAEITNTDPSAEGNEATEILAGYADFARDFSTFLDEFIQEWNSGKSSPEPRPLVYSAPKLLKSWGDRRVSNPQPPVPQTGALTN